MLGEQVSTENMLFEGIEILATSQGAACSVKKTNMKCFVSVLTLKLIISFVFLFFSHVKSLFQIWKISFSHSRKSYIPLKMLRGFKWMIVRSQILDLWLERFPALSKRNLKKTTVLFQEGIKLSWFNLNPN